ncbi:YesK family protein [Saliterribacillus persicus]|uniref:YesK-like protein n=1 Tax=Saliterribacillus persicus TaxID=930114 RepID=A0A368XB36_9BACI|nr:YesK family protein [Saliterribacillus persicus]RCW64218.1 YesK-like protein [Saliterribacillus persicus]
MMLLVPFLTALIPGIIILTLTYWFSKKGFSLFVRMLPGMISLIVAVIFFYIGFVNIRGFEGGSYGFLGFFIIIFSIISFVVGQSDRNVVR